MKFKEIMILSLFSLGMVWIFQNLVFSPLIDKTDAQKSGQRMMAPEKTEIEVHKPLNTEIDFLDAKISKKFPLTMIDTEHARYELSAEGAVLSRMEFYRNWGGKVGYLSTIFPPAVTEREKGSFLVGLQDHTPYYFDLVEHKEESDRHIIVYKAQTPSGMLSKIFEIYKQTYKLTLEIILSPREHQKMQARIFWVSPLVVELGNEDIISGLVNDQKKLKILPKNEELLTSYWVKPTLFGTQDRYFIHALVRDEQNFAQRGYYKVMDLDTLYSIVEGPITQTEQSWKLEFYMGPKEDASMTAVDARLVQTLNYGLFSFISKPLSQLLMYILNVLYRFIHNYGWAIIIMTIILKILFWPFTFRAEESMKKSAELQKKLQHVQSKYKDDAQALAQARAELVRKHGMPWLGGCLIWFLQLPVLWALAIILANAIELYKAPFLWISDLTAPDKLYILPILAAIGIVLHSQPTDNQQRISTIISALLVGAIFSNFSAGLTLFIVVSTFCAALQAFIIRRVRV